MLHPSHNFHKGQLVVFKNICVDGVLYSDYLHEVTKVLRCANYLEIKETKCWHSNRKRMGSYGLDIRPATHEEIIARSRLPKTICSSKDNPKGQVVLKSGRADIFQIVHYTLNNSLLIRSENGEEIELEIFDIREVNAMDLAANQRIDVQV